ncbi:MAG: hypothetical protein MUD12_08665 [Spirochaetes bacterium]|jgi:hypothetical protein|nr:hypothetical protein [Spirochaetota bacterium]
MKRIKPVIIILFYLASQTACSLFQFGPSSIAEYLPIESDVPGWAQNEKVYAKKSEDLKKLGPYYDRFRIREYAYASYSSISGQGSINLEIYRLPDALRAFSLFTIEKSASNKIFLNEEFSFSAETGLYLCARDCFVKIMSDNTKDASSGDLSVFRKVVESYISTNESKLIPQHFKLFNDDARNIIYYADGIDTIPGSADLIAFRQDSRVRSGRLFYMYLHSSYEAAGLYDRIVRKSGASYIMTKAEDIQTFYRNFSGSYIFISIYKNIIYGVLEAEGIHNGIKAVLELHPRVVSKAKD